MLGAIASQPSQNSNASVRSMLVHGTAPSDSVADEQSKATATAHTGAKNPNLPALASNPLADSHEHGTFATSKATLPTVQPVAGPAGLKSAAFLNQGDSEDSDDEVQLLVACMFSFNTAHCCCNKKECTGKDAIVIKLLLTENDLTLRCMRAVQLLIEIKHESLQSSV